MGDPQSIRKSWMQAAKAGQSVETPAVLQADLVEKEARPKRRMTRCHEPSASRASSVQEKGCGFQVGASAVQESLLRLQRNDQT